MAYDKKTIGPNKGTSTEATEQPSSTPDLADTGAPAPLEPEALTVEEQLILEHEEQAALFEMGKAIPDALESPGVTMPKQPDPDKDDKQTPIPGMGDPDSAGKVVDFTAAREGAAKGKPSEKAAAQDKGKQADKVKDAAKPRRGRPPKADKAAPDKAKPQPRDKMELLTKDPRGNKTMVK